MNEDYTTQRLKMIFSDSDRRFEQIKSCFVMNDIKVKEIIVRANMIIEQLGIYTGKNYILNMEEICN